jgi:hydroxymethylpyrimidine pyrophosphatase-like HAD family hydrolase
MKDLRETIVAIDWDHTLWDTGGSNTWLPGALDALFRLREAGATLLIHSCNNPRWIRQNLNEAGVIASVWGESPADCGHKPVANYYIDDRAIGFRGSWLDVLAEINRVGDINAA